MLRKVRQIVASLMVVFIIIGCSYKPPDDPNARPGRGFNLFPEWYDNMLGEQQGGIYSRELPLLKNARIQRGVEDLGTHLVKTYYGPQAPEYRFEFHVVDLDVMNAFALPGGKVFVFRGLLEDVESEAELAGVLAHEMGHAVARHGTKNISKGILYQSLLLTGSALLSKKNEGLAAATYIAGSIGVSLGMLKYSRDYEREADWIAVHNVYRAGFNPEEMITLFGRFEKAQQQNSPQTSLFLSSHPAPEERRKNVSHELPKMAMNREWKENQFGFASMKAEIGTLPPAPKEIQGRPVLAMNSLDAMGRIVADSAASRLEREMNQNGTQTIEIFVPSNEQWIDTSIQMNAGESAELNPAARNTSSGTGSVMASLWKNNEMLESFEIKNRTTIIAEETSRLYLGIQDSDYSDNAGWYVVTTRIRK